MALNILVVDDSDIIREMIARTLRLAAVPVGELHQASDGKGALKVLEDEWIDLVLADINMPVMGGEEMLERMQSRSETADIPVIVISTEGATERVSKLIGNGVAAWIRKPFAPEEIRDVIAQVTRDWPPAEECHALIDAVMGPVLATFAFVFPEPASPDQALEPGDQIMCAAITFSGAAGGTMTLCAPDDLCVELAANILGIETDDPDVRLRGADMLSEVTNIAAGHVSTRIEPNLQTDLHPPTVTRMSRAEWDRAASSPTSRTYVVEGRPLVVTLALRPAKVS